MSFLTGKAFSGIFSAGAGRLTGPTGKLLATRPGLCPLLFSLLLLFMVTKPAAPLAADFEIPRAPQYHATDEARFLAEATVDRLSRVLYDFEIRTGHQIIVYVTETTGGIPVEEWAVKAFEAWRVGRRGLDDGLALFIFSQDRKIRIEVGYGLEDKVPDAIAARVINQILVPGLRNGDADGAVTGAVESLMGIISGEANPLTGGPETADDRNALPSAVNKIFFGLIVLVLVILFVTNPSLALLLLFNMFSGGRGGGFSGGGGRGGFSGGGGRSGGGGATGSW